MNYYEKHREVPLFIVTGVSGAGKSTIACEVARRLKELYVFDMDILVEDNDFKRASKDWMKLAYYNSLSKKSTVLFGNVPNPYDIESSKYRKQFQHMYYLHLTCGQEERARRLRERKVWTEEGIAQAIKLDEQMQQAARNSEPPIPIIDNTDLLPAHAAKKICKWIKKNSNFSY